MPKSTSKPWQEGMPWKLIVLTEPWATLMAIGAKRWETRSWGTNYRGPIAIASSKNYPRECRELARTAGFAIQLSYARDCWSALPEDTLGHVLCVVDLRSVFQVKLDMVTPTPPQWIDHAKRQLDATEPGAHELAFGDYSSGRRIWMTRDFRPGLRRLITPVAAVGHQGLRDLPADVQAKIRKQLPL